MSQLPSELDVEKMVAAALGASAAQPGMQGPAGASAAAQKGSMAGGAERSAGSFTRSQVGKETEADGTGKSMQGSINGGEWGHV